MRILVIALICVMLLCTTAFGYARDMELSADGKVDVHSVVYNRHLYTGLDLYGDGVLNLISTNKGALDSLDNSYDVEMQAAFGTLIPIRAITATGGVGNYALKVAPNAGEMAVLNIRYQYEAPIPEFEFDELGLGIQIPGPGESIFTFSQLSIAAMVQISDGEFRSHINLNSPVIQVGINEDIRVHGAVYFQDRISFDKLSEVEIQIPELE